MSGNIDKLIAFIAENFVFDERTYPELKGKPESERLAFAINHSALHFAKTAGKIATVAEGMHHGEEQNLAELKVNVPKAIVNALRLAEVIGMTEKDIISAIEGVYKKKIST